MAYQNNYSRNKRTSSDPLGKAVMAIGSLLWSLITLPWRKRSSKLDQSYFRNQWSMITALGQGTDSHQWHQAIMEADKLLDKALRDLNLNGESLGERLRSAESRLGVNTYQGLWSAHKVRNNLAHQVGFSVNQQTTKNVLGDFERGLKALGAL